MSAKKISASEANQQPSGANTSSATCTAVSWEIFISCYEELCALQNRPSPTPFDLRVAKSVYDAASKALTDHKEEKTLWRTVSAPTGGGKTTAALAFAAAYVRQGGWVLFLAFTNRDCDEVYRSLELLLKEKVAIRTGDHDQEKLDADPDSYLKATYQERGYTPSAFFQRSRLIDYPALIATHNGFKTHPAELLALKNGDRRALILVDESPNDVDVGVFQASDFEQINNLCQDHLGLDGEGDEPQITRAIGEACKQLLEVQLKCDRTQRYHSLRLSLSDPLLAALRKLAANESLCTQIASGSPFDRQDITRAAKLILNAQAAVGQSFIHLRNDYTHGADFVTYAPDWPLYPGTVLLDATSDIDGYTELTDIRHLEPAPEADYQKLTAYFLDGPRHITEGNLKKFWSKNKTTQKELAVWLHRAISENTSPDERVLVVTWKAIVESGRLQDMDWGGRTLDFCHFGIGVGSNRWRLSTSVFIIGDYVKPGHVTVAETHAIKGTSFSPSADTPIRGLLGDYRITKDGLLFRWLKQLAMRGNARHLNDEGIAEPMNLYVMTTETRLILENWSRLFPSAPSPKTITVEVPESGSGTTKRRKSRLADILKYILGAEGPLVTSSQLEADTGIKLKEVARAQATKDELQASLESHGWTIEFGRGKGQQTKFIKRR